MMWQNLSLHSRIEHHRYIEVLLKRDNTMRETTNNTNLGGRFTFSATSLSVQRIGYGAMQLAGPGVWGLPKAPDDAVAVLR
jgi:hypothetical protein